MVNITAGFILAAYVIYIVSRGDFGRLLWIVGLSGSDTSLTPATPATTGGLPTLPTLPKLGDVQ